MVVLHHHAPGLELGIAATLCTSIGSSRQVTNYRFRKSMGWEIKASLLYQAYVPRLRLVTLLPARAWLLACLEIPTVARDIIYGWARGLANTYLQDTIAPTTFTHKAKGMSRVWRCLERFSCSEAMVFGLTIWVSCSSAAPLFLKRFGARPAVTRAPAVACARHHLIPLQRVARVHSAAPRQEATCLQGARGLHRARAGSISMHRLLCPLQGCLSTSTSSPSTMLDPQDRAGQKPTKLTATACLE